MIHIPNSSNNVSINNNIFWHTETLGQMILLQSGTQDSITISNNLAVEDDVAGAIPFAVYGVHGLAVEHNTIVNDQGYPGTFLGPPCTDEPNCYANSQNMVADYNISVAGQPDFGSWSCASSCVVGRNVSGDSSADSLRGSSGNVVNWTAHWATTTWTPDPSAPYVPPPAGYYQPVGLAFQAGYQGTIGP